MTIEGIDYAYGNPDPVALRRLGKRFVARYLSYAGNSKNLTKAEADRHRAAGVDVVTVFETTANRALDGHQAGAVDAKSAQAQLNALGPHAATAPVYFAVDFDASESDQTRINDYLAGAASVLGHNRVGVYGGYWVCKRALDAKACKYAWQTYAWSGGQWDPRAHIQQYENGVTVAGVQCDLDRATTSDYGQWDRPAPKPKPKPKPKRPAVWDVSYTTRAGHDVTRQTRHPALFAMRHRNIFRQGRVGYKRRPR